MQLLYILSPSHLKHNIYVLPLDFGEACFKNQKGTPRKCWPSQWFLTAGFYDCTCVKQALVQSPSLPFMSFCS